MLYFLISFAISIILVPIFGKLALKYNFVEKKERVIPYLGGMGLFVSLTFVVPFDLLVKSSLTILAILGMFEDVKGTFFKFYYLFVFLSSIIITFKYVSSFYIMFGFLIAFFIISIFKEIDHFDGLGSSLSIFSGVGLYFLVTSSYDKLLILSLLGSLFAFTFYNFPPARIQLGKIGLYLIGGVIAIGVLSSSRGGISHLIPSFVVITPIFLEAIPYLINKPKYSLSLRIMRIVKEKKRMLYLIWIVSGLYLLISLSLYFGLFSSEFVYMFYIIYTIFLLLISKEVVK
ncbi:hypothetical protein [Thermosipho atlanticus]|uniref:UDP-N-acetylmuramyl pentapeptide phosphotransferase/UDP-N-acetylglucosamine-1-phosphate transferase n=1 Tax=Thermosipho atlanticus DSM 15807 TaxID=1123380 RepID=A0A1M5T4Z6_9BACT|nr:hypothetical protein [Thermosipho atlanticus]SHH45827.1 UDP-N-acetylmuramyl pentapeptide phosphotransferase/UDP-N-acetylglucosamine-1-phosphate transferase [Thermosipho atlanticus DSM 15807]